jgi:N utilization substance protein B
LQHLPAIDRVIAEAAPQWPLEQVAQVDKAVLRLAVYELRHAGDTPPKVVINEAVEIAKEYGGEGSGRFINGVLGHVLAAVLPE